MIAPGRLKRAFFLGLGGALLLGGFMAVGTLLLGHVRPMWMEFEYAPRYGLYGLVAGSTLGLATEWRKTSRSGHEQVDGPNVTLWATATSTNSKNGRRIIFRYAKEFRASFKMASQPDRVIIVWKYPSETGQPNSDDHSRMNQLEDALQGAIDGTHVATLALVSTGENLREWTYYAESGDELIERLNLATRKMPAFPIEIHTAHDPTWSMYTKFRTDNPNL